MLFQQRFEALDQRLDNLDYLGMSLQIMTDQYLQQAAKITVSLDGLHTGLSMNGIGLHHTNNKTPISSYPRGLPPFIPQIANVDAQQGVIAAILHRNMEKMGARIQIHRHYGISRLIQLTHDL